MRLNLTTLPVIPQLIVLSAQLIRIGASGNGWVFSPDEFDDKKIRDRIRCFFKTHIQNAKKRLKTLLKNQHKKENQKIIQVARTAVMSASGQLPPANKDMSSKLGLAYKVSELVLGEETH